MAKRQRISCRSKTLRLSTATHAPAEAVLSCFEVWATVGKQFVL